jgi:hypothetical protein
MMLIRITMRDGLPYWTRQDANGSFSFCKSKSQATLFEFSAVDLAIKRLCFDFPSELSYEVIVAPAAYWVNARTARTLIELCA